MSMIFYEYLSIGRGFMKFNRGNGSLQNCYAISSGFTKVMPRQAHHDSAGIVSKERIKKAAFFTTRLLKCFTKKLKLFNTFIMPVFADYRF